MRQFRGVFDMDRNIESSSFGINKLANRLLAVAALCLSLSPAAVAQTCMTESLLMVDETVEVKRPHAVKKAKSHDAKLAGTAKNKLSPKTVAQPLDVSGTRISHAHTEGAR